MEYLAKNLDTVGHRETTVASGVHYADEERQKYRGRIHSSF